MAGSNPPRDFREWQQYVNRYLSESRRGPAQLVAQVREKVEEQERVLARVPAAPVEIQYQTAYFTRYDEYYGYRIPSTSVRLIVDFPDVTRATDGSDITVQQYQLWGIDATPNILDQTKNAVPGQAVPGMSAPGLVATTEARAALALSKPKWVLYETSDTSSFRTEPFIPGRTYQFCIRAVSTDVGGVIHLGQLSSVFTIVMEKDDLPPGQPTAPVVTAERGQLIVTWDGMGVAGAMPGDFAYAVLAMGTASSPTNEVARFGPGGGTYVASNVPYYDPMFFRIQAFDETGNASPWSEQGFNYAQPLVDEDVILSELDAAKTHLKNVDAGVSILPDTIITEHLHVTEEMSAALGQFLHLKAGQIDVNDLWADNAFFGLADAKLVRSDMFIGRAFEGGTFTLTQGGTFQTNPFANRGMKITEAGIQGWNPVGTQTIDLQSATGDAVISGTFYTNLTGSRVRIGARENISALDLWANDTPNHGSLFMFHNPDFGTQAYATQLSHWITDENIIPVSYIQLRNLEYSIKVGSYTDTSDFQAQGRNWYELWSGSGNIRMYASFLEITHKGGNTGGSTPFVRLTESERKIVISTSTLAGQANNYAMLQVVPTSVYGRQNNNNFFDLTSTYFAAQIENGANPTTALLMLAQNSFQLRMQKGSTFYMQTNGNWEIGNSVVVDTFGRGRIIGGQDELVFYPTGAGGSGWNYLWLRHATPAQLTGGFNVYGNFNVYNGTKNFVMPHPTKIGRELVHAATESPYSGIEDWGSGTLNEDGFWIIVLPEYFEPIAAADHRLVKVYSPTGVTLTWTEIMDGQFMIEGPPGAPFGWEVKARREGYEVEVEPWVDDNRNAGEPRVHHPEPREDLDQKEKREPKLEKQDVAAEPEPPEDQKERKDGDDGSKSSRRDRNTGPATSLRDYQFRSAGGGS